MNLFDNGLQERAMNTLIHDSNNAISILINCVKLIRIDIEELEKSGVKLPPKLYHRTERLEEVKKRFEGVIDAYYEKFKNDFK
jgi:hypothetical protein